MSLSVLAATGSLALTIAGCGLASLSSVDDGVATPAAQRDEMREYQQGAAEARNRNNLIMILTTSHQR